MPRPAAPVSHSSASSHPMSVRRTSRFRGRLQLRPLEDRSVPAIFTVTNTLDSGTRSLRQAIDDANAASGADTIVFDSSVFANPQTITLQSALATVFDDVTVTGPGSSKLTVARAGGAS